MIIIGYQGIGKSTLASTNSQYIDLGSECFWVDGKRADDWYKPYCQIAEHLSKQGYIVFTSSHEVVRNYLGGMYTSEPIACIYPAIALKDKWLEKLETRYLRSHLEKDFKAWKNAEDRYTENINEIAATPAIPHKWEITNINYCLEDEIEVLIDHFDLDSSR